ncbi:hypothetical protein HME9302_02623 [Alteripontixanthobacter maritimus]|uniref:Methyltransferase type 11 domain-containing protein n=1 Tax=Alteripontixanthobacter maritimus TaxID=2161824 RepID=A0A369Q942_9SPHN|nr:hypothetical protein [Alteripontixanthobacter maritimus]RDC61401.1 hypothetical protein HME9302_02623 [Alteripontixanthobacter maritimus]
MRPTEAQAIGRILSELPDNAIEPILNLGSSTADFRTNMQPHIEYEIFAPLRARGTTVLHADIKADDGVDLAGDVYDLEYRARILALSPMLIICSNMLEHLEDREGFLEMCDHMLPPGGHLLLTVPSDYPYHQDPIDNYFRPDVTELAALLPDYDIIWSELVVDTNFLADLRAMSMSERLRRIKALAKAPYLYFADRARFLGRYHRWLWLFRNYSIACVLLRKPG